MQTWYTVYNNYRCINIIKSGGAYVSRMYLTS